MYFVYGLVNKVNRNKRFFCTSILKNSEKSMGSIDHIAD